MPIRELEGKCNIQVLSVNTKTWKLEPVVSSRVFSTGEKPVLRLTTQLGRTLRTTANHKFLTIEGWKRLDTLKQGERIALPRTLDGPKTNTLSEAQVALLGHLIGDGCTLPRHAVQYTTRERELANLVVQLTRAEFGSSVSPRISHEKLNGRQGWYQVYLSASDHLTHGKRNPIAAWLDELGIWGLRSHEKFVPRQVFEQSPERLAVFLRHLWSTDGCIHFNQGQKPLPRIYYATSSLRLAFDVQTLLLRLSINARLRRTAQGSKGRDQYHVIISGKGDIVRFIEKIGAIGSIRKDCLHRIEKAMQDKVANTNRDVIPSAIWRQAVVPAMQKCHLTTRQMQAQLGHAYCGTSLYKNNLGRERAARVADVIRSEELACLAESDVYWDRVVSIEQLGVESVYDITVPGHHNFVAGNIIVHNSIEQDADIVMFIYRPEVYFDDAPEGIAEIIIGKHRNGPVGSVQLAFIKDYTRFENLETHNPMGHMNAPGSMPVQPGDENPF
jgi:replicative DNA helicase